MAKNIVFCADGTWNGPEDATGASVIDGDDVGGELLSSSTTNVVKLYANLSGQVTPESLRLSNEQEKVASDANGAVLQVGKYLHGVGDSSNLAVKVMGGVFGAGIIARIVRGFTYISRNYTPGDAIYILGFSRGAYTARALGGMISRIGLLNASTVDLTDKLAAYRLGMAAWCKSHSIAVSKSPIRGISDLLSHLINYAENWMATTLPANALIPNIPIKAVAVWDTVGSYGIPEYIKDKRVDLFRFCDLSLSNQVALGFHAMAIDEMREDFGITRWNPRAGITERWFVGAHADVGGGYPNAESGLSDIGLGWLADQVAAAGARFAAPVVYTPKLTNFLQPIHTPWTSPPFDALGKSPRAVAASDELSPSVQARMDQDPAYRPGALSAWLKARAT